jgi:hypothetical protein
MANAFVRNINRTFGLFAAAARAASAVEAYGRPRRRDLMTLGIDPAAFRSIGR